MSYKHDLPSTPEPGILDCMMRLLKATGEFFGRATAAGRICKDAKCKADYALAVWVQVMIVVAAVVLAKAVPAHAIYKMLLVAAGFAGYRFIRNNAS